MRDFSKQPRKPNLLPVSPSSLYWALCSDWGALRRPTDPQSSALAAVFLRAPAGAFLWHFPLAGAQLME